MNLQQPHISRTKDPPLHISWYTLAVYILAVILNISSLIPILLAFTYTSIIIPYFFPNI